ncbi:MAG: hypothetical protein U5K79_18700 [Cyclobacteriaceae bacterium]|nr:hypothetical protein [Cyclobacteriaceae bacterium]
MREMILSEEELVKRCIGNDRHAHEFLFNQYYSDLYLIAMRYMSDHHDAEMGHPTYKAQVLKKQLQGPR